MTNRQLTGLLIGGVALLALFATAIVGIAVAMSGDGDFFGPSGDRIALVKLNGLIVDSSKTIKQLERYADDKRVKAIVIRVDSPGGGVAASQEIYQELKRLREEKGKVVVVSMGSTAASGGYYVACGADHVVANPGTITGSIGVIAEWYNYGALLDWAQLKPEVIKSGAFKDVGSPAREMTPEERELLQSMVNRLYDQFVGVVVQARAGKNGLDEAKIRALADGRVFTGEEAAATGFVDELGNERVAVMAAAKRVGIDGEPTIVEPPAERPFTILDLLTRTDVSDIAAKGLPSGPTSGANIQFGYVWR